MNWFNRVWNYYFSPEIPVTIEPLIHRINVGMIKLTIFYRNKEDNIVSSVLDFYGRAERQSKTFSGETGSHTYNYWQPIEAEAETDEWFKNAVTFGVYALHSKFIPRERMIEIQMTYSDHYIEIQN